MEKLTIFLSQCLKCPEKDLYKYLIEEINSFPNNYFSLFFLDSFKLFYKDQQLIIDQKNGMEVVDNIFIYFLCFPYRKKTTEINWDSPLFVELSELMIMNDQIKDS